MSLFGKVKKLGKKIGDVAEGSIKGIVKNPLDTLMLGAGVTSALGALDGGGVKIPGMSTPKLPTGPSGGGGPVQGVPQLPGTAPQRQDNSALIAQLMGGQRMAPQQFMQQMGGQAPGAPVPAKPLMAPGMPMPGMQPPQMGQHTTQIQPPQPGNFLPMGGGAPQMPMQPQGKQIPPAALAAILGRGR